MAVWQSIFATITFVFVLGTILLEFLDLPLQHVYALLVLDTEQVLAHYIIMIISYD